MNGLKLIPTYWCSVSGGKDSLFMYKLLVTSGYPLNGVCHFELEIDYPFIKDVIAYIKDDCKQRGIDFISIKPRHTWMDLYLKNGYPTKHRRWCNSQYKLDAKKQLIEYMKEQGYETYFYVGFCFDEVKRLKKDKHLIYPLYDLGIPEIDILQWAKEQPIFNNFYKYNKRCGCIMCPLQSITESAYCKYYYPEKFEIFAQLARDTENEHNISVWQGNKKYNTDYRITRINKIIESGCFDEH